MQDVAGIDFRKMIYVKIMGYKATLSVFKTMEPVIKAQ